MGNYTSSNTDLNPLGIPDSYFDKYSLNEAKNIIAFQVVNIAANNFNNSIHNTSYTYDITFQASKTGFGKSRVYKFQTMKNIHLFTNIIYFYIKNIGYVGETSDSVSENILKTYFPERADWKYEFEEHIKSKSKQV